MSLSVFSTEKLEDHLLNVTSENYNPRSDDRMADNHKFGVYATFLIKSQQNRR